MTTSKHHHRNWLLRNLIDPEWIPSRFDVVGLDDGRRALILTTPVEPEVYEYDDKLEFKPYICDALVEEDVLKDCEISRFRRP